MKFGVKKFGVKKKILSGHPFGNRVYLIARKSVTSVIFYHKNVTFMLGTKTDVFLQKPACFPFMTFNGYFWQFKQEHFLHDKC